ncbi:hypothetical protein [Kibdelosporangium aridum]|uniref:Uncharacterized protein n=1 Tax=Kibdelosporangium aridum TaxID=2030 RepID=A0A1W2FYB1_KIBAR|nr:hypothetical protein [Kibdelosporangium aridum]SMD26939.1 hypothetical protein SAMN05661093_10526 [Kibdelosporangium aridum]
MTTDSLLDTDVQPTTEPARREARLQMNRTTPPLGMSTVAGGRDRPTPAAEFPALVAALSSTLKRIARARGTHKLVLPVKLPGRAGKAMIGGALLPQGPFTKATRTFAEHIAELDVHKGTKR